MKTLCRLSAAAGLLALALMLTPAPSKADPCEYCYQSGHCIICQDYCTGWCTYSCEPGGDGYC
jgi:hypothetical protein